MKKLFYHVEYDASEEERAKGYYQHLKSQKNTVKMDIRFDEESNKWIIFGEIKS